MKKYDKNGKVDKGFELAYFNLSHRRKFIRTIEITIIGVILVMLIHLGCKDSETPKFLFLTDNIITFGVCAAIVITGSIQGIIEYKRWVNEKNSADNFEK